MSEASLLENVRQDIRMRSETDRILSTAWVLVPIIVVISIIVAIIVFVFVFLFSFIRFITVVARTPPGITGQPGQFPFPGFFPFFFPFFGILLGLGIVSVIIYAYLTYTLIKRRNTHFARQWRLTEDLLNLVRSVASRKGSNIDASVSSMERTFREMKFEEGEKSAVLWTILTVISPINIVAGLYVLYFLTRDFHRHEKREDNLLEDLGRAFNQLNVAITTRRQKPIPERNYVLYVVLTIITLGLFGIYWLYTLIEDPNNHFRNHIQIEDEILSKLSPLVTPSSV